MELHRTFFDKTDMPSNNMYIMCLIIPKHVKSKLLRYVAKISYIYSIKRVYISANDFVYKLMYTWHWLHMFIMSISWFKVWSYIIKDVYLYFSVCVVINYSCGPEKPTLTSIRVTKGLEDFQIWLCKCSLFTQMYHWLVYVHKTIVVHL